MPTPPTEKPTMTPGEAAKSLCRNVPDLIPDVLSNAFYTVAVCRHHTMVETTGILLMGNVLMEYHARRVALHTKAVELLKEASDSLSWERDVESLLAEIEGMEAGR